MKSREHSISVTQILCLSKTSSIIQESLIPRPRDPPYLWSLDRNRFESHLLGVEHSFAPLLLTPSFSSPGTQAPMCSNNVVRCLTSGNGMYWNKVRKGLKIGVVLSIFLCFQPGEFSILSYCCDIF